MFKKKNELGTASDKKKEAPKYTWQQNVALYLHDIVYMLVAVMVLLMIFFLVIVVDGPSMENTLLNGDYMFLVSNLFYKNPQPGDVVVVSKQAYSNGKPIVKRVIATEGQEVDIDFQEGIVYVDGEPFEEAYISELTRNKLDFIGPQTVPENCVFVMGDNRNASTDSRDKRIGMVDVRLIIGRAYCVIYPTNEIGWIS